MSLPNFDLRTDQRDAGDSVAESSLARHRRSSRRSTTHKWQLSLGVHPKTTPTQLAALLLHFSASVLFLVFLNSEQPFFISQLSRVSGEHDRQLGEIRLGWLTGRLAFADELTSVFLVLLWGALCDRVGLRPTTAIGYCLVASGLLAYAFAPSAWPTLLWCRLLFAAGASCVTAMLTASLATFSAPMSAEATTSQAATTPVDETTALLATEAPDTPSPASPQRHGRLSSLAGLCTGLGAVVAVFLLLPLPTRLADVHGTSTLYGTEHRMSAYQEEEQLLRGTRLAFGIVACLALLVALLLSIGLEDPRGREHRRVPRGEPHRHQDIPDSDGEARTPTTGPSDPSQRSPRATRQARRDRLRSRLSSSRRASGVVSFCQAHIETILAGFRLAASDSTWTLSLAYLAGALARCVTIASTLFLPLFIAHHFYIVDPTLCPPPASNHLPPSELKKTCRRAYTLTAAQGGLLQTVALVASPLVGLAADRDFRRQNRAGQGAVWVLAVGAACGLAGFGILAFALPATGGSSAREGDPTAPQAWVAAVLLGLCQISSIVGSLTLVARCKDRLVSEVSMTVEVSGIADEAPARVESSSRGAGDRLTRSRPSAPKVYAGAGAIAGAYSSLGALSILLLGSIGGWLFDLRPQGPFEILTGVSAIVLVAAVWVGLR
ncbi:unnamed protein product [Parajaminaea phylloscopi]